MVSRKSSLVRLLASPAAGVDPVCGCVPCRRASSASHDRNSTRTVSQPANHPFWVILPFSSSLSPRLSLFTLFLFNFLSSGILPFGFLPILFFFKKKLRQAANIASPPSLPTGAPESVELYDARDKRFTGQISLAGFLVFSLSIACFSLPLEKQLPSTFLHTPWIGETLHHAVASPSSSEISSSQR